MDPELLRAALRLGVLITLLAAVILPLQDPSSASFVVDVLALVVGIVFVVGVTLVARLSSSPLPSRDSDRRSRYNVRDQSATRTGARTPGGKEE